MRRLCKLVVWGPRIRPHSRHRVFTTEVPEASRKAPPATDMTDSLHGPDARAKTVNLMQMGRDCPRQMMRRRKTETLAAEVYIL